ncbi:hypothetical protein DPMN_056494 [Dreissena polymorpha]|uniref:Uncharacterized protein n=1 Tax=Dreissena polymorpha TaxID=45954 RepID=A0A9D4CRT1_DREPO|nr:hypothetical protein DPMN_056494 [Dreissena polymorpha]
MVPNVRSLKFAAVLSRTHTDNHGINTAVPGPYTTASRSIPDAAIFPKLHGSTRQF